MSKMTPKVMRFPKELNDALEAEAKATGVSAAAVVRAALESHLAARQEAAALDERLEGMEERLAASIGRQRREVQAVRNDAHVLMAMLDTFVRVYLLHTAPVPREAVAAAAASADDRHGKYEAAIIGALQGESGLMTRLQAVFEEADGTS